MAVKVNDRVKCIDYPVGEKYHPVGFIGSVVDTTGSFITVIFDHLPAPFEDGEDKGKWLFFEEELEVLNA